MVSGYRGGKYYSHLPSTRSYTPSRAVGETSSGRTIEQAQANTSTAARQAATEQMKTEAQVASGIKQEVVSSYNPTANTQATNKVVQAMMGGKLDPYLTKQLLTGSQATNQIQQKLAAAGFNVNQSQIQKIQSQSSRIIKLGGGNRYIASAVAVPQPEPEQGTPGYYISAETGQPYSTAFPKPGDVLISGLVSTKNLPAYLKPLEEKAKEKLYIQQRTEQLIKNPLISEDKAKQIAYAEIHPREIPKQEPLIKMYLSKEGIGFIKTPGSMEVTAGQLLLAPYEAGQFLSKTIGEGIPKFMGKIGLASGEEVKRHIEAQKGFEDFLQTTKTDFLIPIGETFRQAGRGTARAIVMTATSPWYLESMGETLKGRPQKQEALEKVYERFGTPEQLKPALQTFGLGLATVAAPALVTGVFGGIGAKEFVVGTKEGNLGRQEMGLFMASGLLPEIKKGVYTLREMIKPTAELKTAPSIFSPDVLAGRMEKGRGQAIIVRKDTGQILLTFNPKSKEWGLPGGKIERGESVIKGTARELSEEIFRLKKEGLTEKQILKNLENKGVKVTKAQYDIYTTPKQKYVTSVFEISEKGVKNIKVGSDVGDIMWVSPEKFAKVYGAKSSLQPRYIQGGGTLGKLFPSYFGKNIISDEAMGIQRFQTLKNINKEDLITIYHGTSKKSAALILKEGILKPNKEGETFISLSKKEAKYYAGKEGKVLNIKVTKKQLENIKQYSKASGYEYYKQLWGEPAGKLQIPGVTKNVYKYNKPISITPKTVEIAKRYMEKRFGKERLKGYTNEMYVKDYLLAKQGALPQYLVTKTPSGKYIYILESPYDVPGKEQLKVFTQKGKRGIIKETTIPTKALELTLSGKFQPRVYDILKKERVGTREVRIPQRFASGSPSPSILTKGQLEILPELSKRGGAGKYLTLPEKAGGAGRIYLSYLLGGGEKQVELSLFPKVSKGEVIYGRMTPSPRALEFETLFYKLREKGYSINKIQKEFNKMAKPGEIVPTAKTISGIEAEAAIQRGTLEFTGKSSTSIAEGKLFEKKQVRKIPSQRRLKDVQELYKKYDSAKTISEKTRLAREIEARTGLNPSSELKANIKYIPISNLAFATQISEINKPTKETISTSIISEELKPSKESYLLKTTYEGTTPKESYIQIREDSKPIYDYTNIKESYTNLKESYTNLREGYSYPRESYKYAGTGERYGLLRFEKITTTEKKKKKILTSAVKKLKKSKAFELFVKKKGKFQKVMVKDLTRGEAIQLGERITRGSLAATFKIGKTNRLLEREDIGYQPSNLLFRQYAIKKGRAIQLEDTWIQRAHKLTAGGSRLGARAEVLEIQAIRKAKSLLKSKKQKGGFWT